MHRVELKVTTLTAISLLIHVFLMHRVELKGLFENRYSFFCYLVPNAPCGVESFSLQFPHLPLYLMFLMHRVELKAHQKDKNAKTPQRS